MLNYDNLLSRIAKKMSLSRICSDILPSPFPLPPPPLKEHKATQKITKNERRKIRMGGLFVEGSFLGDKFLRGFFLGDIFKGVFPNTQLEIESNKKAAYF